MQGNSAIEIDGSYIEGGGQILRIATALSAITGTPVLINKIRANRSPSGLRPQHLLGVKLIASICNSALNSYAVGSTEVSLHPRETCVGQYDGDTKTAGSICLLIQSLLPVLLFAKSKNSLKESIVTLKGGTNVDMAPPIDYFQEVLPFYLERFGIKYHIELKNRGFYPTGGGEVILRVPTLQSFHSQGDQTVNTLQSIQLTDRGDLTKIRIIGFVDGQISPKNLHKMRESFMKLCKSHYPNIPITHSMEKNERSRGKGIGIFVVAETSSNCRFGASRVCRRDSDPDQLGRELFDELHNALSSGSCCDEFMQDQVIIFAALAAGKSCIRIGAISDHTKTAMYVAELLTSAKFNLEKCVNYPETTLLMCEGVGRTVI